VDSLHFDEASLPESVEEAVWDKKLVRLAYRSQPEPALLFGVGEDALQALKFKEKIRPGRYEPCVVMFGWWGQSVEVVGVAGSSRKRKREDRIADGNYNRLWAERRFTDAEVCCGESRFPVHRAVLCAKSRVFAALFEGGGQEAATSQVDMSGEDSGAVAALLEHIYTGSLPEGASATRLLPLADRYEVFDCVDDCAEALEALVLQRPAEALRALRPYQQDGRLRASWQRACDAVLADRALAMAVLSNP